ncbi:MAG: hypothetical protein AAF683_15655 [Pseudomonadota bacterium]
MRQKLWDVDAVELDLEDRDAKVTLVHKISGVQIEVRFRIPPESIRGSTKSIKTGVELMAAYQVLELASYLDAPVAS